ncbi:N-acetylmuramoyl-L-alanine amidase [Microtetraspora sp. NBRC 16547]|uniref:N-acetylmuramoyl-L-alanine amidase n=1 Tax=Microtetraspora sp. NBRC 16547 TaxID=3030993 RepID=UPI0024A5D3A1|nr:N-acetylmuramoyl-L-alanine amidase [Microtetraspora sp. NBRC 16547]GLX00377.1 N-acetylmuramoyl-L-alanine amidase [Microtetraspora sp. NBRC 16547]
MIRRPLTATILACCGLGVAACGGTTSSTTAGPASAAAPGAPQSRTAGAAVTAGQASERVAAAPSPTGKPLAGKVIVIDPGHNGGNYKHPEIINKQVDVLTKRKPCDTTGTATNDGYSEASFTWDVSTRLAKILRAEGATVKLTRKDNSSVGPCITQRAAIGNQVKADAAISIHGDGAPASGHGFHIIMPKKINGPVDPVVDDSRKLGIAVRNAFRSGTGQGYSTYIGKDALDFRNDLGGLNLSTVPKVFIEVGNMRNPGDAAKMQSSKFRQQAAESLAKGITNYVS